MCDDGHVKVAVGRKAGTANGRAGGRIGKFWGGFLSDVLTHDTVAPCKIAVYTQLQPREYKFLALQVFLFFFFFFFFLQRTYIHGYVQYSTRSRYHRDDGGLGNIYIFIIFIYLFIYYLLTLVLGTYEPVKSATCIPLPPPPPKSLD